ncbi:glycerophosphodiester phosphodiesterase [Nocardia sp. CA-129566]|uniref:glycerophosphodiester phosphodiesterase n=1 Tax=Nocardia sp. CA-129566 TaxID=3239976 RepID=UPI003D953A9D
MGYRRRDHLLQPGRNRTATHTDHRAGHSGRCSLTGWLRWKCIGRISKTGRAGHERGMTVVPWTVDDRATMTALVDRGVDGLITNRPDLLRAILAERGYRLPRSYHR